MGVQEWGVIFCLGLRAFGDGAAVRCGGQGGFLWCCGVQIERVVATPRQENITLRVQGSS